MTPAGRPREFLQAVYCGADGDDFCKEFTEYLEQILENNRWDAMSDHVLYLRGAKRAIEEIVSELKTVIAPFGAEEGSDA